MKRLRFSMYRYTTRPKVLHPEEIRSVGQKTKLRDVGLRGAAVAALLLPFGQSHISYPNAASLATLYREELLAQMLA